MAPGKRVLSFRNAFMEYMKYSLEGLLPMMGPSKFQFIMRRNIPSTQALACFEVACPAHRATRAAQELSLTQSAVSRQIQALEEFGAWLFRRTRHGVVPTPAGARHYGHKVARPLAAGARTRHARCHGAPGRGRHVVAGRSAHLATRWLIPRLPQLAWQPDIVVRIETQTRPFLFADTVRCRTVCGHRQQVANWSGIQARRLMHEDVVPVCSPQLLESSAHRGRGRAYQAWPPKRWRVAAAAAKHAPYGWRQWFEAMGVDAPTPSTARAT